MARKKKSSGRLGIVCAWRGGEDDLSATMESAIATAGESATAIAIEDKDRSGPARTRDRGIQAAEGCDVVAIIDAHMRFSPSCLESLARHVRSTGALVCATTYHNAECSMTGTPYHGGRIVYRAQDGNAKNALAIKWSRDSMPGPRAAVVGACYVFPRSWYMAAGRPLSALPGWGGDEELLSISAWLFGMRIECMPNAVAHRYRARPPWSLLPEEYSAAHASRMALIRCVVHNNNDAQELERWQRSWVSEGIPACTSPDAERVRAALSTASKTWDQWRATVCEPDEINGAPVSVNPTIRDNRLAATPHTPPQCAHTAKRLATVYPNGNRLLACETCGKRMIERKETVNNAAL